MLEWGLVQEFDFAAVDTAVSLGWLSRLVALREKAPWRRRPERATVDGFEQMVQESSDPWDYESSPYERAKYGRTLAALDDETGRTLELGCSVGVFTAMLAPRASDLLAVDFSPTALEHAEERVAGLSNVSFSCRTLPEGMPEGRFDTIVCSELLYYWSPELIRDGLARFEAALNPGGVLVAVHWRHGNGEGMHGDGVHELLRAETGLKWDFGEETSDYLLDRWSAPP